MESGSGCEAVVLECQGSERDLGDVFIASLSPWKVLYFESRALYKSKRKPPRSQSIVNELTSCYCICVIAWSREESDQDSISEADMNLLYAWSIINLSSLFALFSSAIKIGKQNFWSSLRSTAAISLASITENTFKFSASKTARIAHTMDGSYVQSWAILASLQSNTSVS